MSVVQIHKNTIKSSEKCLSKIFLSLLMVCTVFIFTSCSIITLRGSNQPNIKVPVIWPGEVDLSKYQSVGIGNFEGKNAELIKNRFTNRLISNTGWVVTGHEQGGQITLEITTMPIAQSKFDLLGRKGVGYKFKKTKRPAYRVFTENGKGNSDITDLIISGNIITHDYECKKGVKEWVESEGMKNPGKKHRNYWRTTQTHVVIHFMVTNVNTGKVIFFSTFGNNYQGRDRISSEDKDPGGISRI